MMQNCATIQAAGACKPRSWHLCGYLTTVISLITYFPLRASINLNVTFCPGFSLVKESLSLIHIYGNIQKMVSYLQVLSKEAANAK